MIEMVELREVDTARSILRQTAVMAVMRQEQPERYLRLDHLAGRTYFEPREVLVLLLVHILVLFEQARVFLEGGRGCSSDGVASSLCSVATAAVQAYGDSSKDRRRTEIANGECIASCYATHESDLGLYLRNVGLRICF